MPASPSTAIRAASGTAARACGAAVANSAAAATMRRGSRTRRLLRRSRSRPTLTASRSQARYALTSHHEGHTRHHLLPAACNRPFDSWRPRPALSPVPARLPCRGMRHRASRPSSRSGISARRSGPARFQRLLLLLGVDTGGLHVGLEVGILRQGDQLFLQLIARQLRHRVSRPRPAPCPWPGTWPGNPAPGRRRPATSAEETEQACGHGEYLRKFGYSED